MAGNRRQWLRKAIQSRLLPAFEQRGFALMPLSDWELHDGESRSAFPFGHLQRAASRGWDTVEIQMARYDAAFSLNIGIVPKEGGTFASGYAGPEAFRVTWLEEWFELYRWPRFWWPFALCRWPGRTVTAADYDTLIMSVVDLIPEVEAALKDGTCGPHVRRVRLPRGTSTATK
jgi:hypothetical protein